MIPIALIYSQPEDAVAQIKYLEERHYPISYVEMGEEADGQYMTPEDNAALYLQFATALHKFDPTLKLGPAPRSRDRMKISRHSPMPRDAPPGSAAFSTT